MKPNKISKVIRILTFHSAYSYGAVLQTYALYKFLSDRYTDVKVIDFRPSYFTLRWVWNRPKTWLLCFQFRFRKTKIKYTNNFSADDLRKSAPIADVYVIGSDQVWNPEITKSVQDIYFGDFIPRTIKKISYAASFGQSSFLDSEIQKMRSLIHDFAAISVREESAVSLCHQVLGLDATCVLDPTFLIDDYTHLFHAKKIKNELGVFVLDNNSDEVFNVALMIAQKMLLHPKILNKNRPLKGFKIIPYPSISCFLKEIYNSRFIITNSFHGLVFSIIFNKQFAFVSTNHKNETRAQSILEKLELKDRLFYSYEALAQSNIWDNTIDYSAVNSQLAKLRMQSIFFLEEHL